MFNLKSFKMSKNRYFDRFSAFFVVLLIVLIWKTNIVSHVMCKFGHFYRYLTEKAMPDKVIADYMLDYENVVKWHSENPNIELQKAHQKTISKLVERVGDIGLPGLNDQDIAEISYILCQIPKQPNIQPHQQSSLNQPINSNSLLKNEDIALNIAILNDAQINYNRQKANHYSINQKKIQTANRNIQNPNKNDQINTYFHIAKKVKSDSQNVHDASVNEDLQKSYQILKNDDSIGNISREIEIFNEIQCKMPISLQKNALSILNIIYHNDLKTYSILDDGKPVSLSFLLNLVWNRAYHPDNINARETIKKSIILTMSECVENDHPVCSGGIAARLLASLVLLDADIRVGQVMSKQQYKNEVMENASKIWQETIEINRNQTQNLHLKQFADSFVDPQIDDSKISESVKNAFYKQFECKIDNMLEKYKGKIPDTLRAEILSVCSPKESC